MLTGGSGDEPEQRICSLDQRVRVLYRGQPENGTCEEKGLYAFSKGKEVVVYLYQQVKEDGILLYGFNLKEEKDLFLKLISVKGIGCKSACTMLASGDVEGICEAIESGNMTYLKKIPGIGPKAAGQIILDLQGKVTATKQTVVNQELEEAMEVLIALGYKQSEVDKVVKKLTDENLDTNGYVKKALSLIVK